MDNFIRAVKDACARFDTATDTGIPALPHVSKSDAEFLATSTLAIEALLRSLMDMIPDPRFGPPNVGLTCASCDHNSQDVNLCGEVDD
jgi:hypothetical protein